jgi:hypothetical protein
LFAYCPEKPQLSRTESYYNSAQCLLAPQTKTNLLLLATRNHVERSATPVPGQHPDNVRLASIARSAGFLFRLIRPVPALFFLFFKSHPGVVPMQVGQVEKGSVQPLATGGGDAELCNWSDQVATTK